ncbi:MAG: hypothetical protein A2Z20_09995 [Bdellovibrionales bacterium RBG_16_40_8]|nr:MAG: hypothetical protein A2Z20_09995 [Bdellovibrionales bacterium RBG_16_40_8]
MLGCHAGKNQTNVELVQDMMDSKSLKSQDYDYIRQKPGNMVPPEGTIPQGFTPYKYAGDAMAAEAKLVNPFKSDSSFIARGRDRFDIYCALCHGPQGKGDGNIAQYLLLKPPSLVSDKMKAFKDGRIYHIITDGQGVMLSYATQIQSEYDRWAIVNYVRELQK